MSKPIWWEAINPVNMGWLAEKIFFWAYKSPVMIDVKKNTSASIY